MGYSIYAQFRDSDEALRMLKFMEANFRYPNEIFECLKGIPSLASSIDKEHRGLSYCEHDNAVGFNYKPGSERYIDKVICWMAHRSLVRKKINGSRFPVFCYDGQVQWAVMTNEEIEAKNANDMFVRSDSDGWNFPKSIELISAIADYLGDCSGATLDQYDEVLNILRSKDDEGATDPIWIEAKRLMMEDWKVMRKELQRLSDLWDRQTLFAPWGVL